MNTLSFRKINLLKNWNYSSLALCEIGMKIESLLKSSSSSSSSSFLIFFFNFICRIQVYMLSLTIEVDHCVLALCVLFEMHNHFFQQDFATPTKSIHNSSTKKLYWYILAPHTQKASSSNGAIFIFFSWFATVHIYR